MTPADGSVLAFATQGALVLLCLALVLAFLRLLLGPSLPDRVVALDLLTVLAVAISALYGIVAGEPAFLDVAIALALVAFLATVALARFAERRQEREGPQTPEGDLGR